jgi:hypothetical protein
VSYCFAIHCDKMTVFYVKLLKKGKISGWLWTLLDCFHV